ncbi:Trehalose-6-phosphate synthase [Gaiella occulta]|uniref:Trehalose-6-phosphate synthase n=1 Tax=Gaiella occulta TaxID=1002870 RepID=A0A7M2YVL0_9ACTN|nr:trehalose-6-phosphate synthase [Gaiella occulta]RDI74106.1 Trehalose-6-phosphate synthase [Gaiella occulta]
MRPLLVVSNRAPVGVDVDADGNRATRRGAGGLVSALRPLIRDHAVTWVASATTDAERALAAAGSVDQQGEDGSPYRLRFVAHDLEAYRLFYEVVANPALWFVQHGLWRLKHDPEADLAGAWRDGYTTVNAAFAAAVLQELEQAPDAGVLFQDYHLYEAPAMVREERPEARLAHFVHIPWPGPGEWSVLPRALSVRVHEGLLACDSVGFHTERWRRAFVESCAVLLGRGDEAAACSHVNPVAVDASGLEAVAGSAAVKEREADLVAARPEILVLRVDRTDPSKNAVAGFAAFGHLLGRRPDLHGRIGMLALLDPSRQAIPEYVRYREALEHEARRVNASFGGAGWVPIDLRVRDDFPGSVAAYRQYDVLLVNPLRDGLNLVAMEAPLVNARNGVLVLSREAGAWEEIGRWALAVDPSDVAGTADALEQALALAPAERRRRIEGIRRRVRAHDTRAWAAAEVAALDARSTMRS